LYFNSTRAKYLIYIVMAFRPILSIVIPVYNEEHNINALIESVEKTLSDY